MKGKISKKSLSTVALLSFMVLTEQVFYLINAKTFKIGPFNYAMIWFALFVLFCVYEFASYGMMRKLDKSYFLSDVLGLFGITLISAVQCNIITGQPVGMGLMPQRNYVCIVLSYVVIRKLIVDNKIDVKQFFRGLIWLGVIALGIYVLQMVLFDRIQFVHSSIGKRTHRLYVDSVFCVLIGMIGFDSFLKKNQLRYLLFVVGTLIYEFFVSKGRLEVVAFIVSGVIVVLLMQKLSLKKMGLLTIICIALIAFLSSSYAERFYEAIRIFNSTDDVNTMAIRHLARERFSELLNTNFLTQVFGCGYPNIDYAPAASMIGYSERMGLVDNGVFAFHYVYGLIGLIVLIKWFVKLYACAWKIYTKTKKSIYLMFMIFSTIISYNITFWWHKPAWTLWMVIMMGLMEYEIGRINNGGLYEQEGLD